jgi:cellobiose transport system permease protein
MKKTQIYRLLIILTLLVFVIVALAPFYIMIVMSTYVTEDLFRGIVLLPGKFGLQNLTTILKGNFLLYYRNSIYIAVLAVLGNVLVSSMAGYGFSKFDFKWKKPLFTFVLVSMMIPTQVGLVAFVVQMRYLGWLNSHLPLIIPPMASSFGVFWMTQFMNGTIPREVIESARVEGCSEGRVYAQIVIPYTKPAIITLGLLAFFGSWNSYLLPLVILNKAKLYTLPLGVSMLAAIFRTDIAAQIMALAIGTIPLIILYLAGSKWFMRGLTAGAVKG